MIDVMRKYCNIFCDSLVGIHQLDLDITSLILFIHYRFYIIFVVEASSPLDFVTLGCQPWRKDLNRNIVPKKGGNRKFAEDIKISEPSAKERELSIFGKLNFHIL